MLDAASTITLINVDLSYKKGSQKLAWKLLIYNLIQISEGPMS